MDTHMLEQLWRHLSCNACRTCPMKAPIYMCEGGHHLCFNCYKEAQDGATNGHDSDGSLYCVAICGACDKMVTPVRNKMAEEIGKLLKAYDAMKTSSRYRRVQRGRHTVMVVDSRTTCRSLTPAESLRDVSKDSYSCSDSSETREVHLCAGDAPSRVSTENSGPSRTTSEEYLNVMQSLSLHTLVSCPRKPCGRMLPCSSLTSHFDFNHHDVMAVEVLLSEEFHVWLNPYDMPISTARAVCLMYITNPSTTVDRPSAVTYRPGKPFVNFRHCIPFFLMSARHPFPTDKGTDRSTGKGTDKSTDKSTGKSTGRFTGSSTGSSSDRSTDNSTGNNSSDDEDNPTVEEFLLFWISGVDGHTFSYKMEVTNFATRVKSVQYSGHVVPIADLPTSTVLVDGNCVVLPPGCVNQLAATTGGLDLNITIT